MTRVVLLAEATQDFEEARDFYNERAAGVGEYCLAALLADIESLALFHGTHPRQHGCYRMLASRFPFGIYYQEADDESRVLAVLDLRRNPSWLRKQVTGRQ